MIVMVVVVMMMMMMQNIHDNRGSHEAKDAKSNRKPVCFYDLSSASVKKKRSSIEGRSWAKRQHHL